MQNIYTLDNRIEKLYLTQHIPMKISEVKQIAMELTQPVAQRIPIVHKLFAFDMSLGLCGFQLEYSDKEFGFSQLLAFDHIFRPIKYVYRDLC